MLGKINRFCFVALLIAAIAFGCSQPPQAAIGQVSSVASPAKSQSRSVVKLNLDRDAILLASAQRGDLEGVRAALARGADVNAGNPAKVTALMFAAANGNAKVVKVLLDRGADINRRSGEGETALMRAASNGHIDAVKVLLAKGAKINVRDVGDGGLTALMGAATGGHAEVVKLLLVNGADVKTKNLYDDTALTLAQKHGHTQIVQILRKAGG